MNSNAPKVLSFFSGCGGLDLGFHQAGFDILYATDFDRFCCESLNANKGAYVPEKTIVEQRDIREINVDELPQDVDFIIGGPPCQSFSASGRRAGGAAGTQDERGLLFESYGNIIRDKKPKGFLFENVRGILGSNKGEDWKAIQQYFRDIGYTLHHRILDACDYGIAQYRERLILVGLRDDIEFLFPRPSHGENSLTGKSHINAKNALIGVNHTEDLSNLELVGGKYSHLLSEVPPGDNYLFFTEKRGYSKPIFAYRSRFSDFLYKADPELPTKTLIASPGKYTGPLHWENRYFSTSEYKRLQGYPDDYIIEGARKDIIRQIGNSVSPKIAYYLALAVKKQIFNIDVNIDLLPKDEKLLFDKRKGKKAQSTRNKHKEVIEKAVFNPKFNIDEYKKKLTDGTSVQLIKKDDLYILEVNKHLKNKFAETDIYLGKIGSNYECKVNAAVYGECDSSIQSLWNAIDDLIIESSNYHSLFEVYGHFTEPHPTFKVENFRAYNSHPICKFAEFASNFDNCSEFLPRQQLMDLFSELFNKNSFIELVKYLRKYRFDIRCKEINIAIDHDKYMIAYPFTLPLRKQMNLTINEGLSVTPIEVDKGDNFRLFT